MRGRPPVKFPLRPDQRLADGGFCIASSDGFSARDLSWSEAIDQFARFCLPPRMESAVVTDSDGVIACGYMQNHLTGNVRAWYGVTRFAGDLAAMWGDRLDPLLLLEINEALK